MKTLIYLEDALNIAMKYCPDDDGSCSKSGVDIREMLDELESLPPAQPERKKGKWVDEKINSYTSRTYCSECGNSAPFICVSDDYYGRNMHGETKKTKFCPNCGAKMEEEK